MSELNFSKKQLKPIIEKFHINIETNEVFASLIKMFDNQPNYQLWAVKSVFSNACSLETITQIREWINNYQNEIQSLIKGNIILYKTPKDFSILMKEMRGLSKLSRVRNAINTFNTRQREMLKSAIIANINDGMQADGSTLLNEWFSIFSKMEKLVSHRKEKLISTSSAIDNLDFLKQHIVSALEATYDWNKEDMKSYLERNATDSHIVYEKDDVVVVNVKSFPSSKKLCGNGRTGWCLTREERYFDQYVGSRRNTNQYFLFDFSKREDDELAHIGFTVNSEEGITNAHSTRNYSLLGSGINYHGRNMNINQALHACHIPQKFFMPLKPFNLFKWSLENGLKYVEANSDKYSISYCKNNILIIRCMDDGALSKFIRSTFMNGIRMSANSKCYLILDFNVEYTDDNSIVAALYDGDAYGTVSFSTSRNGYNNVINYNEFLESMKITENDFVNQEKIDPKILLHKLINERKEDEAIQLIENEAETIDVNYEFQNILPIFSAIDNGMSRLFSVLLHHKSFDASMRDSFGESLLQSLLFNYDENDQESARATREMINIILHYDNFDFNILDINFDTALIIACDNSKLNWVVEALVNKPQVDLNVVNDFNCTALTTAIRRNNIKAIQLLSRRDDLIVRQEDIEMAQNNHIELSNYLTEAQLSNIRSIESAAMDEKAMNLSELFAKAFSNH